ncbi:MAG: 1-deoxy-D-xylulose-5-phosphate reductoisomerase, partial [Victivallales bacterium]|nr:1-deoxy-D-xylulose-5-phosphate reductoisomerase [Victivallales bacterium]
VHALVELTDGTLIAQLSAPDMRMPIRYGLSYPSRLDGHAARMSPLDIGQLDFAPIDELKFPALNLARQALKAGGTMPAVLSASNDVAVTAFLNGRLPFTRIWDVVEKTMDAFSPEPQRNLSQLLQIDANARRRAAEFIP